MNHHPRLSVHVAHLNVIQSEVSEYRHSICKKPFQSLMSKRVSGRTTVEELRETLTHMNLDSHGKKETLVKSVFTFPSDYACIVYVFSAKTRKVDPGNCLIDD